MCCCGKPVINGQLGYKWQPNDAPSVREPYAPELREDDSLIFDEPGRCGGLDHHSYHFRLVKRVSSLYLLVRHGGGQEEIRLFPHRGIAAILVTLDSNARFWILATIYDAYKNGKLVATDLTDYRWQTAAAENRIKTRKVRNSARVKVWIEPKITTHTN